MDQHLKNIRNAMLKSTFKNMEFSPHKKRQVIQSLSLVSKKKRSLFDKFYSLKPILSIIVCILFLFGSSITILREFGNKQPDNSQSQAVITYELPLLYEKYSKDIGLQKAHKMGLTNEYDKTIASSNVSVHFTRAYYDGVKIIISYNIINNSEAKWPNQEPKMIGASDALILKGDHEFEINGSTFFGGMRDRYITVGPNKYEGLLEVNPSRIPKGDSFVLEGHISEIQGVKGSWDFKLSISKEKTIGYVQTFTPNIKVKGPRGETIQVRKVSFTPTAIGLETETVTKGIDVEQYHKLEQYLFGINGNGDNSVDVYYERPKKHTFVTVTRSTFPSIKDIPKKITVEAYNSSKLSEHVLFEVPLGVKKEEQNGFFSKLSREVITLVEGTGEFFKNLF